MQECITFLFHKKKTKNNNKNVRKTCYWKLIFVISREHVGTQSTQGTWACTHARHVGMWACKYARHVGTWARKHSRHVGTWARKARNLADSLSSVYLRLGAMTRDLGSLILKVLILYLLERNCPSLCLTSTYRLF